MTSDSLATQEWLDHIAGRAGWWFGHGVGLEVVTGRGAPCSVLFDGSYRTRRNPATRREVGNRAWSAMCEENRLDYTGRPETGPACVCDPTTGIFNHSAGNVCEGVAA